MPESHFHLQRLEVVRDIGFDLAAHPLARPLLEAVEFLVDIHAELYMRGSVTRSNVLCAATVLELRGR